MNAPAIRNHQSRPPNGGWAILYELDGQKWMLEKGGPYKIVESIGEIQKANGRFVNYARIWDYCNKIWTGRDPKRALPYKDSDGRAYRPSGLPYGFVEGQRYRPGCSTC